MQSVNGVSGRNYNSIRIYKDPENPKHLIVDPQTALIVKRIFEMYSNGIGIVRICNKCYSEKITSPSVYLFNTTGSRSGKPDLSRPYNWVTTTIRRILSIQTSMATEKDIMSNDVIKQAFDNNVNKISCIPETIETIEVHVNLQLGEHIL